MISPQDFKKLALFLTAGGKFDINPLKSEIFNKDSVLASSPFFTISTCNSPCLTVVS